MTFIIATHLTSALLTLFIATSLISCRALKPVCARILGVIYLLFCVQNVLAVCAFSDMWPQAVAIRALLAMLIGPALLLYFNHVLELKKLKQPHLFLHLLPLPVTAIAMLLPLGLVVDFLIIGSFCGYLSYILFQYRESLSKYPSIEQPNKFAFRWLGLVLCVMLVNLVVELGIVFEAFSATRVQDSLSLKMGSLFFLGFHVLALTLILIRSPLMEWMHKLKELSIQHPKRLQLAEEELQVIFIQWEELVVKKALYLSESGITISRAAKQLGIPTRQLSQAINTIYGASFSHYLNEKRVELAKNLLQQNVQMPITEIYLAAGFSTKSHFHREFSRSTGVTPSEFKKMNK